MRRRSNRVKSEAHSGTATGNVVAGSASGTSTSLSAKGETSNIINSSVWSSFAACEEDGHAKKKNCKGNPLCLFGLQHFGGIWKEPFLYEDKLGPDPSKLLRSFFTGGSCGIGEHPKCGLTNLGATCYLNVFIQMLFNNRLVREAINNIHVDGNKIIIPMLMSNASDYPPSGAHSEIAEMVSTLQVAFGHMESCNRGIYDLGRFIVLLGLDTGEQQDPQEFSKLFFCLLEKFNLPRRSEELPTIRQLICGKEKYSTKCSCCCNVSEQLSDFNEIGLNIEGCKDMLSALQKYLSDERLDGENQYWCSQCNGKRDAIRKVDIVEAPAVLFVKLIRYIFDRSTCDKKKLKTDISFPAELTLNGERYELVAVLYHKGVSAHGGHYVTEVLDMDARATGKPCDQNIWWLCDDQVVTQTATPAAQLEPGNAQAPSSSSRKRLKTARHASAEDDAENSGESLEKNADKMVNSSESNRPSTSDHHSADDGMLDDARVYSGQDVSGVGDNSSVLGKKRPNPKGGGTCPSADGQAHGVDRNKDAYMLSYVKKSRLADSIQRVGAELPEFVHDAVEKSSQAFMEEIRAYEQAKSNLENEIRGRKEAFEKFIEEVRLTDTVSKGTRLLPAVWLQQWAIGEVVVERRPGKSSFSAKADVVDLTEGGHADGCRGVVGVSGLEGGKSEPNDDVIMRNSQATGGVVAEAGAHDTSQQSRQGDETAEADALGSTGSPAEAHAFSSSYLFRDPVDIYLRPLLCPHYQVTAPQSFDGGIVVDKLQCFKMIPESAFRIIMQSLNDLGQEHPSQSCPAPAVTVENFLCKSCLAATTNRHSEVKTELESFEEILRLVAADETSDSSDSDVQANTQFRLSKAFVTTLKNLVKSLTKEVLREGQRPPGRASSSAAVDTHPQKGKGGGIDMTVNSSVMCSHQRLGLKPMKGVRGVSAATWTVIQAKFPDAISLSNDDRGVPNVEGCSRESDGGITCGCARVDNAGIGICDVWFCCSCERDLMKQQSDSTIQTARRDNELREGGLIELYQRLRGRKGNISRPSIVLKAKDKIRTPQEMYGSRAEIDDSRGEIALISGLWLEEWLHFIAATTSEKPRVLDNAELRCDKHKLLIVAPHLQDIKGMSCLDDIQPSVDPDNSSNFPDVEFVTVHQWEALVRRYGSEATQPPFEVHSAGSEGSRQWSVRPCAECIDQLAKDDETARRSFQDERFEISVSRTESVALDGVSTAVAVDAAAAGALPSRRSARSTRSRSRDRLSIVLSSGDQISLVKLKIFQEMDDSELSPLQIVLFCGERELNEPCRTLSDCGVLRGQRFQVKIDLSRVDAGEPIDDSFAAWFSGDGNRKVETGFQGTLLGGASGLSLHHVSAIASSSSSFIDIVTEDVGARKKSEEQDIKEIVLITRKSYEEAARALHECGSMDHAVNKLLEL